MFRKKRKKKSLAQKAINYAKTHPAQVISAVTATVTAIRGYVKKRKAAKK